MPGYLVEGQWRTGPGPATHDASGQFVRKPTTFRSWITPDGAPGPTGEGGFAAEAGRYHLYVSYACPWAHRTLIFRKLKGLEENGRLVGGELAARRRRLDVCAGTARDPRRDQSRARAVRNLCQSEARL